MEELIEKLTLIDERLSRIEAFMEKHRSDAILNANEAQALCNISLAHLYRLTSTAQIPHFKRGGKLCFKRSELEDWLLANRVKTKEEVEQQAMNYIITSKSYKNGRSNDNQIDRSHSSHRQG